MNVLPAYIYVHCVCALCPRRLERGIGLPGTGVELLASCHMVAKIELRFSATGASALND